MQFLWYIRLISFAHFLSLLLVSASCLQSTLLVVAVRRLRLSQSASIGLEEKIPYPACKKEDSPLTLHFSKTLGTSALP